MTQFSGAARRIGAGDLKHAADRIGCELAALRAVLDVESKRSGFDERRRPVILFEPHVFYRALSEKDGRLLLSTPKREAAVAKGLAYPRWGEKPYPRTSDGNYERLKAAIAIDAEKAFQAISMGLGQVLGENHEAAGFPTAVEMFKSACESEGNQLEHMVGFIEAHHLADELRRRDWRGFAAVYNGKGQVAKYAGDLAKSYAKWKRLDVPRESLTAKDLREAGSRTIQGTDQVKGGLGGLAGAAATAGAAASQVQDIAGQVQSASDAISSATDALTWAEGHWKLVMLAVAAIAVLYFAWRIWSGASAAAAARVDDARSGVNERI